MSESQLRHMSINMSQILLILDVFIFKRLFVLITKKTLHVANVNSYIFSATVAPVSIESIYQHEITTTKNQFSLRGIILQQCDLWNYESTSWTFL